jgi:hypothetical protein
MVVVMVLVVMVMVMVVLVIVMVLLVVLPRGLVPGRSRSRWIYIPSI